MITPVAALIVAAGRGRRLGAPIPKQYLDVAGRSLLRRSLEAVLAHPRVSRAVVVIGPDDAADYGRATANLLDPRLGAPVIGGAERQDSVRAGLEALALQEEAPGAVLIHDAARPGVSIAVIDRLLDALTGSPGAIPGLPVADALWRADGDKLGAATPREGLIRAQTPQAFEFHTILAAHRAAAGEALADDAAVAQAAGLAVAMINGAEEMFKVTTADDFTRAVQMFSPPRRTRLGNGYDVHRFGPGDHVILCGVRVPHDAALMGHSDADVGLHALTDALLGAVAEGDIGRHFPPSDPQWKGVDSAVFLRRAVEIIAEKHGRIENLDLTLVCEHPKITPHAPAMRARVADICGVDLDRVSIKATTSERLGFTGRGEGIAALATACVSVA